MKCNNCKKQKKAENCQACRLQLEEKVITVLEDIKKVAEGTLNMNIIIGKIEKSISDIKNIGKNSNGSKKS